MKTLFSLEGRIALVTGGSRGIGRMIAEGFLEYGAKVYISARKAEACNATAEELSARGGTCISLPHDISSVEGCRALAEDIRRNLSRVGPLQGSDSLIQEQEKEPILTLRDTFSGQKSTLQAL